LRILLRKIKTMKISNISIINSDFSKGFNLNNNYVSGILFAFSLHYHTNIDRIISKTEVILNKNDHKLIIIDYNRKTPLPWVPYPYYLNKMIDILKNVKFIKIKILFSNNRYYILEAQR
ncbi:MAG: hypothetical protein ACFFD1_15620, partial [Candidatus Thorarchaeota archaeon]